MNNDGTDSNVPQQHDVSSEIFLEIRRFHRRSTVLDDHGLSTEALYVRQSFQQRLHPLLVFLTHLDPSSVIFSVYPHVLIPHIREELLSVTGGDTEIQTNIYLIARHDLGERLCLGLRQVGCCAILHHLYSRHGEGYLRKTPVWKGCSRRAQDPSPIGIPSPYGRLDQRRICNRPCGHLCIILLCSTFHGDTCDAPRSLSIRKHHQGQAPANRLYSEPQSCHHCFRNRDTRGATGQEKQAIVRAHLPIDGYAIEGSCNSLSNQYIRLFRTDIRVSCDDCEHCCHLRTDHPGALRRTSNPNRPPTQVHINTPTLGEAIRCQYALRKRAFPFA